MDGFAGSPNGFSRLQAKFTYWATAYQKLFKEIIVGELDDKGNRPLQFVLRGDDLFDSVNRAANSSVGIKMAQEEGLEPPTKRLTAACSTN